MALICINGCKECTGCLRCIDNDSPIICNKYEEKENDENKNEGSN